VCVYVYASVCTCGYEVLFSGGKGMLLVCLCVFVFVFMRCFSVEKRACRWCVYVCVFVCICVVWL